MLTSHSIKECTLPDNGTQFDDFERRVLLGGVGVQKLEDSEDEETGDDLRRRS